MTSWYKAICDGHAEVCSIFLVGHTKIYAVIPEDAEAIAVEWLAEHWTCKLRLVRDDNEDWPKHYIDRTPP